MEANVLDFNKARKKMSNEGDKVYNRSIKLIHHLMFNRIKCGTTNFLLFTRTHTPNSREKKLVSGM